MRVEDVVRSIISGELDENLDGIAGAIKARKDSISESLMFTLKSGDVIRFNSQTRPKYLQGLKAEIVRSNRKTLSVKITPDDEIKAGRFRYGPFKVPISLVEKV